MKLNSSPSSLSKSVRCSVGRHPTTIRDSSSHRGRALFRSYLGLSSLLIACTVLLSADLLHGAQLPQPNMPPTEDTVGRRLIQAQISAEPQNPSSPLTMNSWVQKSKRGFAPIKLLQPKEFYYLHVHVSQFPYGELTRSLAKSFYGEIEKWLKEEELPTLDVKVLAVANPDYLRISDAERVQTLTIDLNRIRKAIARPQVGSLSQPDFIQQLKMLDDPEFVFGRVAFPFATTSKTGNASMGLVFWVNGERPVDELVHPVCIGNDGTTGSSCNQSPELDSVLKGADSFRLLSRGKHQSYPDAALQFFELDTSTFIGILRRNEWPESTFEHWLLEGGLEDIRHYFQNTLDGSLNQNLPGGKALVNGGFGLFNLLFPPVSAESARRAFTSFVEPLIRERPFTGFDRHSIFVRMIARAPFTVPLPVTLLNIRPNADPEQLLGFHVRFELPLSRQDYARSATCISNWVALMPPPNAPDLWESRKRFRDLEPAWKLIESIDGFRDWLGDEQPSREPTAIFTLSHHDSDDLSFDQNDRITSAALVRQFPRPSVAVLNGCGSKGNLGPFSFLNTLNRLGIGAAIVTNAEVDANMAGDFYACFLEAVKSAPVGGGIAIGEAYSKALKCLSEKRSPKYGLAVLSYTLLGNTGLRLCYPR